MQWLSFVNTKSKWEVEYPTCFVVFTNDHTSAVQCVVVWYVCIYFKLHYFNKAHIDTLHTGFKYVHSFNFNWNGSIHQLHKINYKYKQCFLHIFFDKLIIFRLLITLVSYLLSMFEFQFLQRQGTITRRTCYNPAEDIIMIYLYWKKSDTR